MVPPLYYGHGHANAPGTRKYGKTSDSSSAGRKREIHVGREWKMSCVMRVFSKAAKKKKKGKRKREKRERPLATSELASVRLKATLRICLPTPVLDVVGDVRGSVQRRSSPM